MTCSSRCLDCGTRHHECLVCNNLIAECELLTRELNRTRDERDGWKEAALAGQRTLEAVNKTIPASIRVSRHWQ